MAERRRKYWNEKMETMPDQEMRRIHENLLLNQFEYIYKNSLFYQEKLQEAGLGLGDIRHLQDLSKIPFTNKTELREAQKSHSPVGKHRACPASDVVRIYSSSGTTGIPSYLGVTRRDIEDISDLIAATFIAGGFDSSDMIINIPTAPFIADLFREGIEKTGAIHVPTGFNTERVLAAFEVQKANGIQATVSFASYLLHEVEKKGLDPKRLGLRKIYVGGEGGTEVIRQKVQEGFGATMIQAMGIGEISAAIWAECIERRDGMHFLGNGIVHFELIDPESGRPLKIEEGAQGEIVYTGLNRECMPLFRYRSGDNVKVVGCGRCLCGRTSPRIKVLGRTDDMLTVLGVNVYPLAVKDVIAPFTPRVSGEIEIQLEEPGPQVNPPMKVKVELGKEPGNVGQLKQEIDKTIRSKLMFRADVELVKELPHYEYKGKLVRKLFESR